MQIVCKDLKQHELVVNELEDARGEKNMFLADPGHLIFSSILADPAGHLIFS